MQHWQPVDAPELPAPPVPSLFGHPLVRPVSPDKLLDAAAIVTAAAAVDKQNGIDGERCVENIDVIGAWRKRVPGFRNLIDGCLFSLDKIPMYRTLICKVLVVLR